MRLPLLALIGPALPFASDTSACHLDFCKIGNTSYSCDIVCTGALCVAPSSLTSCDVCPTKCVGGSNNGNDCTAANDCPGGTCSAGDGKCTICGSDDGQVIIGSTGPDVICTAGGDDAVYAQGGDDIVLAGGRVVDASGNPIAGRSGPPGNDLVHGGNGNDQIFGNSGNDVLFGEGGNDIVIGCGGRNYVDGGDGDDVVTSAVFPVCGAQDDAVGSLLCGGKGNDILVGAGPSHQCMDAGPDQAPAAGTQDCTYAFTAAGRTTPNAADLGTAKNCANPNVTAGGEPCGCDR